MVKHTPNFNIFNQTFLHHVLQTLYEVAFVEIIKNLHRSNLSRQENEDKFWFIISCPYLKPVAGIKIDSTAELSDRAVIISFK